MKDNMEWISVKDRLPDNFVDVLVISIDQDDLAFNIGSYYNSWSVQTEYKPAGEVTHWMPLPKPPKL